MVDKKTSDASKVQHPVIAARANVERQVARTEPRRPTRRLTARAKKR